jgi:hypothetical protein
VESSRPRPAARGAGHGDCAFLGGQFRDGDVRDEVFTAERVSEVYRQPVKIALDTDTGAPHVIPVR